MPLNVFRPLSPAEHHAAFLKIARRAMLIEYDRAIIQNAQNMIQRSRELLDETKHQVIPSSQRG